MQVAASKVQDEVRRAIQKRCTGGRDYVEVDYSFINTVASALGISPPGHRASSADRDWDRLGGQIGRSLEKLSQEPAQLVIKVASNEPGPDGHRRRGNRYYIPERHAALAAERAQSVARHEEARARWQNINRRLSRMIGRDVTVGGTTFRPMLTADEFEQILDRLEEL